MDQDAFFRAILDDPEDDTLRLAQADWLEEHGHDARAAWIRASCDLAPVRHNDPNFGELVRREWELFRLCRPEWWTDIKGVTPHNDRGLFRFEVRSKTAATRLGKVSWLGDAVAGGWLEGISIGWCDGSLARVVARWKSPARAVPLFVKPAPQISDEGLALYLDVPHLWGLDLTGYSLRNPSAHRLLRRSDLRELRLAIRSGEGDLAIVLEPIGQLVGLRLLAIQWSPHLSDDHLALLGGLTGLRRLHLWGCKALTDVGLSRLTGLVGLRRLDLWGSSDITEAGIVPFRRALPQVRIESY
jgi:uncharacterized protein (TIGR02996 family)